jgi:pyruvate-formate lyase-activating enzyme
VTVRLLAYHDYARDKYRYAGMADTMPKLPPPSAADLEEAAAVLRSHGLRVVNSLAD